MTEIVTSHGEWRDFQGSCPLEGLTEAS